MVFQPSKLTRPVSATVLPRGKGPQNFFRAIPILSTAIPLKGKFRFDALRAQSHSRSMITVPHPVEDGPDITDHVRRTLDVIQITGIITDTPLGVNPIGLRGSTGAILNSVPAALGAIGVLRNRAHSEFEKLNELFEKKEPVFLATSIRTYDSVIIKDLSLMRTGNALEVDVTFEEIIIVPPRSFKSIDDLDALLYGADGVANRGTQPAEATNLAAGGV